MSLNLIEYDYQVISYTKAGSLPTNCIDMQFINGGTVTAYIDNLPLLPGQSIAINGNLGEVCKKTRNLTFANVAGTTLIYFLRRFYLSTES